MEVFKEIEKTCVAYFKLSRRDGACFVILYNNSCRGE